jgi:hypothetical protein
MLENALHDTAAQELPGRRRRHPMACCFSAFKQLFATGQNFSYGLTDLGRYYADYADLMSHWDHVLPGVVLRVYYEETVRDTEAALRRLLEYCQLPFEHRCLRFYETERAVRTAKLRAGATTDLSRRHRALAPL